MSAPPSCLSARLLRLRWLLPVTLLVAAVAVAVAPLATAEDYGDVRYQRKAPGMDDVPPALFPHWIHRMQYKCGACHDKPYKMKAGANPVTMDDIQGGRSCGVCHNGEVAFISNLDTCGRCHRP